MKKIYMLSAALFASASMLIGAQSLSQTTALWGKAVTSAGTTQGNDIALAKDGGFFMVGGAGSKQKTHDIMFGDEVIGKGTDYTGTSTSGNQAFFLSKVAADGSHKWTVYSNNGEVGNNQLFVCELSDGGVVAAFKFRHTSKHYTENPIFVDATGAEIALDWKLESESVSRYYKGILMKVSATGTIEWIKQLDMDHSPRPKASSHYSSGTPESIFINGCVADASDNLYLTGRICTDMYINEATSTNVITIPAHNNAEWDGDTQKDAGNMFVIKFNGNGNYVKHLITEGASVKEGPLDIDFADGKLYILSIIKGIAGTDYSLDGHTISPANGFAAPSIACLDTDLKVNWFRVYASKANATMQMPSIQVFGNNIWVAAKAKIDLDYTLNGETKNLTTGSLTRDGIVIKANAQNGDLLGHHTRNKQQAGYFDTFEDESGGVYMMGMTTLFSGVTIEKFDPETVQSLETVTLYSNASDCKGAVGKGAQLFVMTRTKGTGNSIGDVFSLNPAAFSCMLSSYRLPFNMKEQQVHTGVAHVQTEKTVTGVQYYNLQGIASSSPFEGVNIVVTRYSDGSQDAHKIIK